MWTFLFLTVSLFSSFQCSPAVYSRKRVDDFVLHPESTKKELQQNKNLEIKIPFSSVRTNNPSGISPTVTSASSMNHDTSLSLKNHANNKKNQTEKALGQKETVLIIKHTDFNDTLFTNDTGNYFIIHLGFPIDGHLKNASHPERNDNETTNTHNVKTDDNKRHDYDKETIKEKGRMITANGSQTHLNKTSSANKNIDPRTSLESIQRFPDKLVNTLKMLKEKEFLNVTSPTPNAKNSTAEITFSKSISKFPFKGKLVTVTEGVKLEYRKDSNSDDKIINTRNESAGDKKYDGGTTKQVDGMTETNHNEAHLNKTKPAVQTTDPRATVLEKSRQGYTDKNMKMMEEKEVLNVTSLAPSDIKSSIAGHDFLKNTSMSLLKGKLVTVTEEINLRYREDSNSYNRTTKTHNESADDKRYDYEEGTTTREEGMTKTNHNDTRLNKTRPVNQTIEPRTILMEQSGQRQADKNVNTLKKLEEKVVLNVTSLAGSNVKNSNVTEKANLSYMQGLNSDNRTTNNYKESADDKRHDHDGQITNQEDVTIKANSNITYLSETRSANQTKDSRPTLIEQSGQRHANKSVNILKLLEGKEVLNTTALTPTHVKNSTAEPEISNTTSKSTLEDILVLVYNAKNEKVNIKTPFIPSILLEA